MNYRLDELFSFVRVFHFAWKSQKLADQENKSESDRLRVAPDRLSFESADLVWLSPDFESDFYRNYAESTRLFEIIS